MVLLTLFCLFSRFSFNVSSVLLICSIQFSSLHRFNFRTNFFFVRHSIKFLTFSSFSISVNNATIYESISTSTWQVLFFFGAGEDVDEIGSVSYEVTRVWWPTVANFNLNVPRNFKPHLNFNFEMKIKSKFTFQIGIRNQIDFTFTYILCFICCPSWLVISLIRLDFTKMLSFWNGNFKSNGSDGPSWPITAIIFCRTNINVKPS